MIEGIHPVWQGLVGTIFTWFVTALGAAAVFILPEKLSRDKEDKILTIALGFASGVMLAASYWSLLAPCIELSEELGYGDYVFIPPAVGFLLGAFFVWFADKYLPHPDITTVLTKKHDFDIDRKDPSRNRMKNKKGKKTKNHTDEIEKTWHRVFLLVLAVTVHNIPEGLAVGVGFGAIGSTKSATFAKAYHLALGIGIQNFPEGLAVSLPLRRCRFSKLSAFFWGQLSGMVEPIAGFLGAWLVLQIRPLLPYFLSFAGGAMVYVVVDDIIPETSASKYSQLASLGTVAGFIVMMSLDVGLG